MAERVVRNVENDYLMCSICLGRYTDPRLLPCGHTFCRQCLDDHIKQTITDRASGHFNCPNDRTQVTRPRPGLAPKDWASTFPVDTFLSSLLSAVMIHASQVGEEAQQLTCDKHKGRLKEFFCLKCSVPACTYCVVKSHKADSCECVSLEEAVEKSKPKIEVLRNRLQKQSQQARQVLQGEHSEYGALRGSKERAMVSLTDLETKLKFYFDTAMKQIMNMKNTIRETGKGHLSENQQVTMIIQNINDTIEKLDEVSNHGAGVEILNLIPRIEGQVIEYENALKSIPSRSPEMEVHFVANRNLETILENAPALGSVVLQQPQKKSYRGYYPEPQASSQPLYNTPRSSYYMYPTPRSGYESARSSMSGSMSARSSIMSTPRHPELTRRRSEPVPQRPKLTITVNTSDQATTCWQLTGVAIFGGYVVVTDAHNGKVIKCLMTHLSSLHEELTLDCPVCIVRIDDTPNAMVTQPEKSQLALISTDTELTLIETIATAKPYEGIAKLPEGNFVVSCCVIDRQCIDIIDVNGEVLKSIDKDPSGSRLFSWPRFLSTTPSGNILVSDRDQRSLMCLDADGTCAWTHQAPASPWGVSCHENGVIYLCMDNNEVETLAVSGHQIQRQFITGRDDISVPYAVHAVGEHVVVTEWGSSLFSPNSPWIHVFFIED